MLELGACSRARRGGRMAREATGGGLFWWLWERAVRRLRQWVRAVALSRDYRCGFRTGGASYIDFTAREIVIAPDMTREWTADATAVPTAWGGLVLDRPGQLSVYAARAAAYHEAGHAVFTTPIALPPALHDMWNILEDERQERLVARVFPPAAADLYELGRRFWLNGYPSGQGRARDLINACLYHRWDNDRPDAEPSRLIIADEHDRVDWEERLRPLVERAWDAESSVAVVPVARRILEIIGVPEAEPARGARAGGRGQGATPRGARPPGDREMGRSAVVVTSPALPGGDDGTDDPSGDGGSNDTDGDNSLLPTPTDGDTDGERGDEGDAARRARRRDARHRAFGHDILAEEEDSALGGARADVDPSGGILWMQPYQDLERTARPLARRVVAQLRVRDDVAAPMTARSGVSIDMRAYVRSRGQRPFVRAGLPGDSPRLLRLMLAIDGTGSMGGAPCGVTADNRPADPSIFHNRADRMPHVRRAALALLLACGELGVPLAVAECCDDWLRQHPGGPRGRAPSPVTWIKRWETPAASEGPKALIAGLYGHAESEALVASLDVLVADLAGDAGAAGETRVLIYVHDGRPTDDSIPRIQERLRRARGIVVIGLYVGPSGGAGAMREIFGSKHTIVVDEVGTLPAHLGGILKRYRVGR